MTRRGWILFSALSVIWGVPYFFIRVADRGGMPPLDLAWLRIVLAALILLGLAGRRGTLGQLRGRLGWVGVYAVVEIAIPFSLIAVGERHVASSLAAIVIAAVPLIVAVLALGIDAEERPTPRRSAGLLVGFAGVVALVGLDVSAHGQALATVGLLVSAVGYALGPLLIKHRLGGLDAAAAMGAALALAALALTVPALLAFPARAPSANAFAAVAVLGVICTAVAFLLLPGLVGEAGPARASVITYVNPIVAVLLGVTLLGERLGAGALVGLGLILSGSWLATGPGRGAPAIEPAPADGGGGGRVGAGAEARAGAS
ncbi:MAG TPA: EamA family transporter [Solirubrobacteraceae bacterium]|nr:EamA family transporter [Solirubrobacteraceae bacterium]